jgi:hypothetical protein
MYFCEYIQPSLRLELIGETSALNIAQSQHLRQIHQAILTGLAEQTSQVEGMLRSHMHGCCRSDLVLLGSQNLRRRTTSNSSALEIHTSNRLGLSRRNAQPTTQSIPFSASNINTMLNARNLRLLCNIETRWTSNLTEHLTYDSRLRVIKLFYSTETPTEMPLDLAEEVDRSLALLFPDTDSALLHSLDQPATGPDSMNFLTYSYFGDCLRILQDELERQTPRTLNMLWHDRRNKTQWYTLWLTIGVGASTVFLGVVQCAMSIVQVSWFVAVSI